MLKESEVLVDSPFGKKHGFVFSNLPIGKSETEPREKPWCEKL